MGKKKIVICGATGQQGGAVITALLKSEQWDITAVTRNPDSTRAIALKNAGLKIVKANLLHAHSLVEAFEGADAVFGVTQPWSGNYRKLDVKKEIQSGKNIVDACLKVNVPHLVISTALSCEENEELEHVNSKLVIETYLKQSAQPYTILQPASFMDNIGMKFFPIKKNHILGFVDGDAKIPLISVKDIGEFAAMAFAQPISFRNVTLHLVGDYISGDEIAASLGKLRHNEHFRYKSVSRLAMKLFAKPFYKMRVIFEKYGRPPHGEAIKETIAACRKIYPDMMTMAEYLKYRKFDTHK